MDSMFCLIFGHHPSPDTVVTDITRDGYNCARCGVRRLWKNESWGIQIARREALRKLGVNANV